MYQDNHLHSIDFNNFKTFIHSDTLMLISYMARYRKQYFKKDNSVIKYFTMVNGYSRALKTHMFGLDIPADIGTVDLTLR